MDAIVLMTKEKNTEEKVKSRINIDRNCDVLPIVEYSIETDDGQTLN